MKKFLTVIGTRPQLVKYKKIVPSILVNTGQHYTKSLLAKKIPKPQYNLNETRL
jgi:UDP-N-acetylglucosamine 2-epimerase